MPAGMGLDASSAFTQLARDLHKMPAATRRGLRQTFERSGQAALSDARSRAKWSRRIPAAISGKSTATENTVGYTLRVSAAQAPHARPYEGIGLNSTFRHPVFGHRGNRHDPSDKGWWVTQKTRPYLYPAVRGRAGQINRDVLDAVEAAARECGFR